MVNWFKSFCTHNDLLTQLVARDIKLKYRRSFLGYLWSVLNPLMTMVVLWIVFSNLFRFDIPNYPVYLLTGQIMFNFMNEATNVSMMSIVGNAPLLKKTYVPKYIFTLSRVTSTMVNLIFSLVALLLVIVICGVPLTKYVLLFWVPIVQLYFFCLGLSLLLAQGAVFFRDLQYLWGVALTAWLYLTPIFYPITIMTENLQAILKLWNPMYAYIAQFRACFYAGEMLDPLYVGLGLAWAVVAMVAGAYLFFKNQDKFILYI